MKKILLLLVFLSLLLACPKKPEGNDVKPETAPGMTEENAIDEADRIIEELDNL